MVILSIFVIWSCEKTTGECDADDYVGTVEMDNAVTTCTGIATEFDFVVATDIPNRLYGLVDGVRTYEVNLVGLSSQGCQVQFYNKIFPDTTARRKFDGYIQDGIMNVQHVTDSSSRVYQGRIDNKQFVLV